MSQQQVIYNQLSGAMSYANAVAVAQNQTIRLNSFRTIESKNIRGLTFGAIFSDRAAWNGAYFNILINNSYAFTVLDELGDLLRPVFLPVYISSNDLIEVDVVNNSVLTVDVTTIMQVVI